jgi:hypothetical protein
MYLQLNIYFSFNFFQVILNSKSISTELTITNTDNKPFSFTSALHTYFSVSVLFYMLSKLLFCWSDQISKFHCS